MNENPPSRLNTTLASTVYFKLRDDILNGVFETGAKLPIDKVVSLYDCGASPVREALNRLATEGLLDRIDQRGFFVRPLTLDELRELTRTRCWLEERALRESIANRSWQWEEQLVLALHRLARATEQVQQRPSSLDSGWEEVHRAFHRALLAGCGSNWLISFCEQINIQTNRYRLLARGSGSEDRDCMAEHRIIAEAAIDGDADRAVAALLDHYQKSAALVTLGDQRVGVGIL